MMPTGRSSSNNKRSYANKSPSPMSKKRTANATTSSSKAHHVVEVVTPSPTKRQRKHEAEEGNDHHDSSVILAKQKDVSFYMCRFRHGGSARELEGSNSNNNQKKKILKRKEFPPEAEIMAQLRQLACGSSKGKKDNDTSSCSALRDFIKSYGVERNFRGMTAENVLPLLPIVQHIQNLMLVRNDNGTKLDATKNLQQVIEAVDTLADLCKESGYARNLSFATKVLNMLGHNVPIYSSECKTYLGIKNVKSYGEYAAHWMTEFEKDRILYETEAARKIQNGGSSSLLENELGPTWFAMRGLDQTMCRIGAPKQRQNLCPACMLLLRRRQER